MGIPMVPAIATADIHSPTVPARRTPTPFLHNGVPMTMEQLIIEKRRVEAEMTLLGEVLAQSGVDMHTSLLTGDGYPRADIDVAQIRITRTRIICLRNDYKDVMDEIEKGLHQIYQSRPLHSVQLPPLQPSLPAVDGIDLAAKPPSVFEEDVPPADTIETPFATVDSVMEGSPAADAGIRVGDAIRRFGNVVWLNHEQLRRLAVTVGKNEGKEIMVRVQRGQGNATEVLELTVVPSRAWGGRGALGCHFLQI